VNEPVKIEKRRRFRQADVVERYRLQDGVCDLCPAELTTFICDHRVPRAMGGKTNLANLSLVCEACAAKKDPADISRIAKAKRQGAPRKVAKRPMKGRGFDKRVHHHMDGTKSPRSGR
jgi:5-methylcytosine-specific restriction endonuclease McrA